VLTVAQPAGNHNGGSIEFNPSDGFLYIALGDGGGSGDPGNHGQNKETLLGALLRIDVNSGNPYGIPQGNVADGAPEVYDWGLRNPYRFNFDLCTGDRYIGDVGQGSWEEINVAASGDGNKNWGWRIMEGTHCFNPPNGCNMAGLDLPVAEYPNPPNSSASVVGGHVYRGASIPWLRGSYFYGDFYTGQIWTLRWQDGNLTEGPSEITADIWDGAAQGGLSSFGTDNRGEMYVLSYGGTLYRIVAE
jgi:glucose/arabinose dehydrogenase